MANEQNLKPMGSGARSESEERALQSKGGKNSGATRRRKKTMKAAAKMLMDMPAPAATAKRMEMLGIDKEDATYQMAVMVAIMQEAMNGNVKAATFIRDTMGENPVNQIHQQEVKLKKDELKFKQEQEQKQAAAEAQSSLVNAILEAYEQRKSEDADEDAGEDEDEEDSK